MNDWLEELASALGVEPLSREEVGALLRLAREVAHGVERRFAPLSTFLVGVAVGRGEAFDVAMGRADRLVPPDGSSTGGPPAG